MPKNDIKTGEEAFHNLEKAPVMGRIGDRG
jgi:hypothetical protein